MEGHEAPTNETELYTHSRNKHVQDERHRFLHRSRPRIGPPPSPQGRDDLGDPEVERLNRYNHPRLQELGSDQDLSGDAEQYQNKSYLISVLNALRKKQSTAGNAGISALFSGPDGATHKTPHTDGRDDAGSNSDLDNSSVYERASDYTSMSKRRKGGHYGAAGADYDNHSDTNSNCGSATSKSASTYIAQLSCDIASNRLQSDSPSSMSSSSSSSAASNSPLHARLSTTPQPALGDRHDTAPRVPKAGWHNEGYKASPPMAAESPVQREESAFATAHTALLATLPPQQLPAAAPAHHKQGQRASYAKLRRKQPRDVSDDSDDDSCDTDARDEDSFTGEDRTKGAGQEYSSQTDKGANSYDGRGDAAQRSSSSAKASNANPVLDTSEMSVEEILHFIRVPNFVHHVPDNDTLKDFLDQHEIGHLNHLIKCFTDAIFTVSLPESAVGKTNILPIDFLHVYCCCVLRVYFLLFKNLDFMNLLLSDQVSLLECGVLKALLCMSFFVFKEDSNSWHIPSSISEINPVILKMTDLNQIMPHNLLQQTLAINITSTKLKFDWPMGMLCIGAFFYSPIDVEVQQADKIEKLRDRYMEILLKYLKWKHGPYNASLMFPEILKLMDAILKHCNNVENLTLRLRDDEIEDLEKRLKSLSTNLETKDDLTDDRLGDLHSGATFAKINHRITSSIQCNLSNSLFGSSVDLRHCAAVPTASMYYSNLPLESEEAKSRREVEALLIRRLLQSKQQQQLCPNKEDEESVGNRSDVDDMATTQRLPQPSHMSVLAIQRLLLDLARKEQIVNSPEHRGLSPSSEVSDDSPLRNPVVLPYQALQHKLQQATALTAAITKQQQHAHLTNFAKSLGYRSITNKPTQLQLQPQSGNSRVTITHVDNSNAAIDLSQKCSSHSLTVSSIPTTTLQSLPKVPELKPLPVRIVDHIARSPPASSRSFDHHTTDASDCRTNSGTGRPSNILSAYGNTSSFEQKPASRHPAHARGSSTSQLSARQIELLLESLGQSKYNEGSL